MAPPKVTAGSPAFKKTGLLLESVEPESVIGPLTEALTLAVPSLVGIRVIQTSPAARPVMVCSVPVSPTRLFAASPPSSRGIGDVAAPPNAMASSGLSRVVLVRFAKSTTS